MVRGITTGLSSRNSRSPNTIHNKSKDCNHNEIFLETSRGKDKDEVPPELQFKRLQMLHWRGLI